MPRPPRAFAVFGFETTHDALAAEDVLKAAGVEVTPVPAPKGLGALCGLALRVPEAQAAGAQEALAARGIALAGRVSIEDV